MGYIDTDKLKEEINKRYQEYRTKYRTKGDKYYEGMADSLGYFEQFIDSLEPSISSSLEEAAEEYAPDFSNSIASKAAVDAMRDAFKAGAVWQARQGQIFESVVWQDSDDRLFVEAFVDENKFKMADVVTIQVRKKQ